MWEENVEPDEEDIFASQFTPDPDPISAAVGSPGFYSRYTLEDCRERFENSRVMRDAEKFDRFYWEPERILIDILQDGTAEQLEREHARKRVEFKTAWCAEHGWRYVVLPESDAQDTVRVRELLHEARSETPANPVTKPVRRPARRGQVQRPKATA